jgi:hypothetical protein
MKALKLAGAAIAAVIVVIALLLVIGIPSGFLTAQIQERVERETGYKLAINGGARLGLWPSLNISLNDVTLQHPKDASTATLRRQASRRSDPRQPGAGKPLSPSLPSSARWRICRFTRARGRPVSSSRCSEKAFLDRTYSGGTIL